jgi:hypothetical protein
MPIKISKNKLKLYFVVSYYRRFTHRLPHRIIVVIFEDKNEEKGEKEKADDDESLLKLSLEKELPLKDKIGRKRVKLYSLKPEGCKK